MGNRFSDPATTAESCTGGWIAKAITDVPGSSAWLR
ncbi:CinA family protein, partial [Xylella fastidiosa]